MRLKKNNVKYEVCKIIQVEENNNLIYSIFLNSNSDNTMKFIRLRENNSQPKTYSHLNCLQEQDVELIYRNKTENLRDNNLQPEKVQ